MRIFDGTACGTALLLSVASYSSQGVVSPESTIQEIGASITIPRINFSWQEQAPSGALSNSVSYLYDDGSGPEEISVHSSAALEYSIDQIGFEGFLDTRVAVFSGIYRDDGRNGMAHAEGGFSARYELSEPHLFQLFIDSQLYAARLGRGQAFYSFNGPGLENVFGQDNYLAFDLYEGAGHRQWELSGVLEPGSYGFSVLHEVMDRFDQEWTFATSSFRLTLQPIPDDGLTISLLGCGVMALAAMRQRLR